MEKAHGIMFHYFHDNKVYKKGPGSRSAEDLEKMIIYCKEKYNLLNADEWLYKEKNNTLKPGDIFFSFDDCVRSEYDIAYAILKKYSLTTFWFVYTSIFEGQIEMLEVYRHFRWDKYSDMDLFYKDFFDLLINMEKDLNINAKEIINRFNPNIYFKGMKFYTDNDKLFRYLRNEILTDGRYNMVMDRLIKLKHYNIEENKKHLWITDKELKQIENDGNIIGLHTHTHPTFLEGFSRKKQAEEYYCNREVLENLLNNRIYCMAHPCNSYNNETLEILRNMGITIGFRADMVDGYNSKLEYPREDSTNLYNQIGREKIL